MSKMLDAAKDALEEYGKDDVLDHVSNSAQDFMYIEYKVGHGVLVYRLLKKIDHNVRLGWATKRLAYTEEADLFLESAFERWTEISEGLLKRAKSMRRDHGNIHHDYDELVRCLEDAR